MIEDAELERRFKYHAPDAEKGMRHELLRERCRGLAGLIDALCVDGREKSLAITALEEALMWANASVARHEVGACDINLGVDGR